MNLLNLHGLNTQVTYKSSRYDSESEDYVSIIRTGYIIGVMVHNNEYKEGSAIRISYKISPRRFEPAGWEEVSDKAIISMAK